MAARRDLGPEFEDALVESFLQKMDDKLGQEVDRRVEERLKAVAPPGGRDRTAEAQRLALAIVSLALGTLATVVLAVSGGRMVALLPIWTGIVIVNVLFRRPFR